MERVLDESGALIPISTTWGGNARNKVSTPVTPIDSAKKEEKEKTYNIK